MGGRNSQKKGKKFQHVASKALAAATGLSPKDFNSNHGGVASDEDIYLSEEARRRFPFRIETKNQKRLAIPEWWRKLETEVDLECGERGIIIMKIYGRAQALVVLDLMDFLDVFTGPLSEEVVDKIQELLRMR